MHVHIMHMHTMAPGWHVHAPPVKMTRTTWPRLRCCAMRVRGAIDLLNTEDSTDESEREEDEYEQQAAHYGSLVRTGLQRLPQVRLQQAPCGRWQHRRTR